jgi:thiol-disulfide isomerase/thioredoxin
VTSFILWIRLNKFMNTKIIIGVLIIIVAGGVYVSVRKQNGNETEAHMEIEKKAMMEVGTETKEVMEKKDTSMTTEYVGKVFAGTKSPLLDFNKADYDKAIQSNKLVVLYFYASWCPNCREEFPKMETAFNNLAPDQVVGFRLNYKDPDTDSDEISISKQFGIAYQHTKVFLKDGKVVLKSPESWDMSRYQIEIANALK